MKAAACLSLKLLWSFTTSTQVLKARVECLYLNLHLKLQIVSV